MGVDRLVIAAFLVNMLKFFLYATLAFFTYLMWQITWQYRTLDTDTAFLRIKQDYIHLGYYRVAFFVHAFSAIVTLLAGFTQFSSSFLRKYPIAHRRLGWIYAGTILAFAGPSGFIIGLYANGGTGSRIAFCLLAVLWMFFTSMALWRIVRRDVVAHRRWMIRSFALTLSAITLRAEKYLIVALFEPRPMDVYRLVAWTGWVLNLAVAEWWIIRQDKRN